MGTLTGSAAAIARIPTCRAACTSTLSSDTLKATKSSACKQGSKAYCRGSSMCTAAVATGCATTLNLFSLVYWRSHNSPSVLTMLDNVEYSYQCSLDIRAHRVQTKPSACSPSAILRLQERVQFGHIARLIAGKSYNNLSTLQLERNRQVIYRDSALHQVSSISIAISSLWRKVLKESNQGHLHISLNDVSIKLGNVLPRQLCKQGSACSQWPSTIAQLTALRLSSRFGLHKRNSAFLSPTSEKHALYITRHCRCTTCMHFGLSPGSI